MNRFIRKTALTLFLCLLTSVVFAAISANTVFEVRNGGSGTAGGGFVTGAAGTDWSQQTALQYSVTDGVTAGTTSIVSATAAFGTDVVGDIMYVQGGTGTITAGWYQIVSRTNSTTVVVDRSTGLTAGTGVTLHIGGCFDTPGRAAAVATVAGNKIWVKYNVSDYTISTATPGADGPVALASVVVVMQGYDVTRGDDTGNRPTMNWGAVAAPGALTYLYSGGLSGTQSIINCRANGNSVNNVGGFTAGSFSSQLFFDDVAVNCNGTAGVGFTHAQASSMAGCLASACTTGYVNPGGTMSHNRATACVTGFSGTVAGSVFQSCLSDACTGDGFNLSATSFAYDCVSYGNATDGFDSGGNRAVLNNCVSILNGASGGYAFAASATLVLRLMHCFDYNPSATGRTNSVPFQDFTPVNLAADPFISSSDFRPNTTASGLALKNAGIAIPGITLGRSDAGVLQHADPPTGYSRARTVNR